MVGLREESPTLAARGAYTWVSSIASANMPSTPPSPPSLIDFPCHFPIKVMGTSVDGFNDAMAAVVRQFDIGFDPSTIETRRSQAGKYTGLTLMVYVHNREQLDEVYRALTSHPMVKVAL